MAQAPFSDDTAKILREAWFRYLDSIGAIREPLYGYCRRITGNVWDGEDLLQDTLLKGFGAIGRGDFCAERCRVRNSRTYLFRIATNLWIDQIRQRRLLPRDSGEAAESSNPSRGLEVREAAALLMTALAPQQRAAVVLKDALDFSLEEIAEILSTTVGAVKSALSRGRSALERGAPENHSIAAPARYREPSKELIDRFIAALNARDPDAVAKLLNENTTLEVYGIGGERGKTMIHYSVSFENAKGQPGRSQGLHYRGEWIVLVWAGPPSNEVLINVERVEEDAGTIAHIRSYYFCPEVIAEIARDIGAKKWLSPHGQTQPADTQTRIVADAVLPWIE